MIDGKGQFLMPGLVEGHCHLSSSAPRATRTGRNPARRASAAHLPKRDPDPQSRLYVLLFGGFRETAIDVVVRQEIEDGYLAGPRYRAAGPEITTTGGLGDERKQHMHAESFGMIADGVDEIRRAVRLCCREGVDNVKFNIRATSSSATPARKSSRSAKRS